MSTESVPADLVNPVTPQVFLQNPDLTRLSQVFLVIKKEWKEGVIGGRIAT